MCFTKHKLYVMNFVVNKIIKDTPAINYTFIR